MTPAYLQILSQNGLLLFLAVVWSLPWKGMALWRAARLNDQRWFIILLVVNTLAILDIVYIYFISKRKSLGRRGKNENAVS